MPADIVIKLRRGTAAEWTSANPVLAAGEMGVETDTNRSKFGDGTTTWSGLSYTVGDSSGVGTIDWNSVLNKPVTFNVISDTAPVAPTAGQKWLNTTNFIEYVYYDSAWVEV